VEKRDLYDTTKGEEKSKKKKKEKKEKEKRKMRVESCAEKNAYPRPSLELELLGFVVSNLSGLASVFVRDEENE